MPLYTNRLANESSPYLLQHAHNPVNWFPWGDEALAKAKTENKAILISIGYSSCHWCHVMEKESFEDEATAQLMNEHFINIKIDREERPDLDHIYMDAVQAIAGNGGWPLNVFLTPDAKPFFGGTYFPPQRAFNRPSWKEVLLNISETFKNKREEVETQAENLIQHLEKANSFGQTVNIKIEKDSLFNHDSLEIICKNIMKQADIEWGGFGKAPKFPQTGTIQYLLRHFHYTKNEEALKQALLSLDKMIEGGIYDHLQGGLARYATDTEWLAPHFEKMLYDNALLVSVLSEAYQLTKKESYRLTILQTIEFIKSDLMHPDFGFYSALDADSEGEEGKYYVWNYEEVKSLLGEDTELFCAYFDVSPVGNWESKNILRIKTDLEKFAVEKGLSIIEAKRIINEGKAKLLVYRNNRIKPMLDDKVILSWNALMNTALSKAYAALGEDDILKLAEKNMSFLLGQFKDNKTGEFKHTWKNNEAKYPAFLDDYAFIIQALLNLSFVSANSNWLDLAVEISKTVTEKFAENDSVFFYFTSKDQEHIVVRKKEIYDGAMPSANAVMASNLLQMSVLVNDSSFREKAEQAIQSISKAITDYPTSFSNWACLLQDIVYGYNEISIIGEDYKTYLKSVMGLYIPNKICMASASSNEGYPLLAGKNVKEKQIQIYLCKNYTCQVPVQSIAELKDLLIAKKSVN